MIDTSSMKQRLEQLPVKTQKALMAYGRTAAMKLQEEAQKNRPWRDRTAQARQRMKGYCVKTDTGIRIYLAHGVGYGVFLEFSNEKKYAVIYPILRRKGPEIIAAAVKVVARK